MSQQRSMIHCPQLRTNGLCHSWVELTTDSVGPYLACAKTNSMLCHDRICLTSIDTGCMHIHEKYGDKPYH